MNVFSSPSRSRLVRAAVVLLLGVLVVPAPRATTAADHDELVVIVNEGSGVPDMSAREIRKLFLGKSRRLPDGSRATIARFEPAETRFNRHALRRTDAQVTAAWSRLRFSGRVRAPRSFASVADVEAFVATTPSAIAYLPAVDELSAGVRVVFVVPR